MRFAHPDASARGGRGGVRLGSPAAWVLLALGTGCVVQRSPRIIEGDEALAQFHRASATSTVPPAPLSAPTPGPSNAPAVASAGPVSKPAASPTRVRIVSAQTAEVLAASRASRTADGDVKRAAQGDRVVVPSPSVIPPPSGEHPIDLATALRLADEVNPTINRARTMILEALAYQLTARTLLVPSLNGGASYHGHNGVLQRSSGKILNLSEQSLYVGGGAYTVAAESVRIPAVSIFTPLTDAWFEPLAAHQRVIGTQFNARATENEILVDVAVLHLELIRNFTLLEAHRLSETQAYQIVQAIEQYAISGQGRQSDYERAKAEWGYRRADVQQAEEGVGIAAARLARRLNLDPSVRLHPAGGPLVPLHLVALETPPEDLIRVAIEQRPDIAQRTALINEADLRVREEIGRPFLPTLWLGFSGGAFGGGSNLVPPLLGRFAGRTDFDVRVYWTFLNLGAGNLALIKQRQAQEGQAVAERARILNLARSEVIAAQADAKAARNQIEIARRELKSSHEGFHEDLARSRSNLGRPIEVINSLNLLARARASLIDALVRYDQAQFRLWVALGTPPPLVETSTPDQPPVPEYLVP